MATFNPRKLVTTPQFREVPMVLHSRHFDSNFIRAQVRENTLIRIRKGHYAYQLPEQTSLKPWERGLVTTLQSIAGAQHFVPEGTVFSHTSAAALWGLPLSAGYDLAHISVANGHHAEVTNLKRHLVEVPADEQTVVSGVPVTSLARTVVDCLRVLEPEDGLAVADAALRVGLDRSEALEINRRLKNPRFRKRTADLLHFADIGAESPGESRLRYHLGVVGWEGLSTQLEVRVKGSNFFLDMGDLQCMVGFEFDGLTKYADPSGQNFRDEKVREQRLQSVGWRIERFMWEEFKEPWLLRTRLRKLAAESGSRLTDSILAQHDSYVSRARKRVPRS